MIVRIVAVNTGIVAADDTDKGKLRLGKRQLTLLGEDRGKNEFVVILSHHPWEWLGDGRDVADWVNAEAHAHLCGHIHEASSELRRGGGGGHLLNVVSGAAHGDKAPQGYPSGHGYAFGALVRKADGKFVVRIWPRLWSERNKDFRADVSGVPPGEHFAEHETKFKV